MRILGGGMDVWMCGCADVRIIGSDRQWGSRTLSFFLVFSFQTCSCFRSIHRVGFWSSCTPCTVWLLESFQPRRRWCRVFILCVCVCVCAHVCVHKRGC